MRLTRVMVAAVVLTAARAGAQHAPDPPPAPPPPSEGSREHSKYDPASVEHGKQLLVQQCGFCHGSNARGGQLGPDLTRSDLVQSDEGGKQLSAFLKVGRPDKKMPKFDLPEQDAIDIATFLHSTIDAVSNRGRYQILNILVGDPKAGEAFFNGGGKCSACHSPAGDLKGVGSKYDDAAVLQGRLVMPRGRRRRGPPIPGQNEGPPWLEPTAVKATVSPASGEPATGPLVRLTDFDVTIYDPATQQMRTWLRNDGTPPVTLSDPLQAHVDMLRRWTDRDLHNVTAYLATLK